VIISRTPYRISFFGGGTDYPQWYLREEGAVLSTTIDKYCYLSCRYLPPFFPINHRVVWSYIEAVSSISEILHPAVRECLKYLGFDDSHGLEIYHQGDLPARSGIGTSSSFSVGLLNALHGLRSQPISKHELAVKAIELEQKWLKENSGSQDQVAAAYGGLNIIRFEPTGEINVQQVACDSERLSMLQSNLMLFYLGTSRIGADISGEMLKLMPQNMDHLRHMRTMVDAGVKILTGSESLDAFGHLLHETWSRKRELATNITNATVDAVYDAALSAGALGGKLLGAGGSGFMLFYVPIERQKDVREKLSGYLHVPFEFENDGSQLIYSAPEVKGNGH
jgi:D-glycero-alpha-D-manno-heptose-7-phosphate kinase